MTTDLATLPQQARDVAPSAAIVTLWQQVQADYLPRADFFDLAVTLLHVARSTVAVLVSQLLADARPEQPIQGSAPHDYSERDRASLETVTEDADTAEERLENFVTATLEQYSRDELLDVAADYGATGWVWRTDGEPCDYCRDREGTEYDMGTEFRDHPHCDCYPEPIFDGGFSDLAEEDAREEEEA